MTEAPLPQRSGARRILAVFNPAAGRKRRARFDAVVAAARVLGCTVAIIETTARGHAERIAREVDTAAFDVIAAAGGDGTINEIANGLIGKDIALGIIPLGTANVVADEIGLKRMPEAVARALAQGPMKDIRLGRANGRRFIMMAGVGFDANVVAGVSLALKKKIGPLAYVWQAARQAWQETFTRLDANIDGRPAHPVSLVICNGKRYGGPFVAAPEASLNDDCLHVVLMNGRGWFSLLRYGVGLVVGALHVWRDVDLEVGREITVAGPAGRPVQADGDIIAHLPLHVEIDPEPVRLIYPD